MKRNGRRLKWGEAMLLLPLILVFVLLSTSLSPSSLTVSGKGLLSFSQDINVYASMIDQPFGPQEIGNPPASPGYPDGWLDGWPYRTELTANSTLVDSNLTDFPMLVKLTSSNFDFSHCDSNGYNIRFTTDDGETLLPYDRERHSSPNAEYWFAGNVSSSTDTIFYMYYRTSSPVDGEDAANVWKSEYKGVYHLAEDPSGTPPQVLDSTSNAKHLTTAGTMLTEDLVDAQIGKGLDFDGADDEATINDAIFNPGTSDFSLSAWIKTSTTLRTIIGKQTSGGGWNGYNFDIVGGKLNLVCSDGTIASVTSTDTTITDGNWHHVVAVRVGNDRTNWKLYVDGDEESGYTEGGSDLPIGDVTTASPFRIANRDYAGVEFLGIEDEVSFVLEALSAAWIKASYYSGKDELLDYGSEEEHTWLSGWSNRKTKTIDGAGTSPGTISVDRDLLLFTDITEVDPNSKIAQTSKTKITYTNLQKNEDAYSYFDLGTDFIDRDFEIRFKSYLTSSDSGGSVIHCSMANQIDDWDAIDSEGDSELGVFIYYTTTAGYHVSLREVDSGTAYSDSYNTADIANLQPIYIKFKRVEADGDHGTIYAYLYSDSTYETLVDTLEVALHTSKKDFRYLYFIQSRNSGNDYLQAGYVEDVKVITPAYNEEGALTGHFVTGSGTAFGKWNPQDQIQMPNSNWYDIYQIIDDTELRLIEKYVGSAASGQDYAMRHKFYTMTNLTLHYGSGTDDNTNVYLNEDCETDFSDVRFTRADGETLLHAALISKVDSDNAVVQIEIPTVPENGSTIDICIYWGNASASAWWTPGGAFHGYDDWEDNSEYISWKPNSNNPIITVAGQAWHDFTIYKPCPVYRSSDGKTHVFYYGRTSEGGTNKIGRAYTTDTDVMGLWTDDPSNPVIDVGGVGDPDEEGASHPAVKEYDGYLWMFYGGYDGSNITVCLAKSTIANWGANGTWVKEGMVMDVSGSGWDSLNVYPYWVLTPDESPDGQWWVFYGGTETQLGVWLRPKVGIAKSPDGTSLTKFGGNPVLVNSEVMFREDQTHVGTFCVFKRDTGWVAIYNSGSRYTPDTDNWITLGYSDDCEEWHKYDCKNPIWDSSASGWDDTYVLHPYYLPKQNDPTQLGYLFHIGYSGGANQIGVLEQLRHEDYGQASRGRSWYEPVPAEGTPTIQGTTVKFGTYALKIHNDINNTSFWYERLLERLNNFTITLYLRAENTDGRTGFGFGKEQANLILPVFMQNDGHFKYYTGAAWSNFSTDKTYTADTWYKVELRIRTIDQKFDILIDDALKDSDIWDSRYSDSEMDWLGFSIHHATQQDAFLDHLSIRRSAETEPAWGTTGSEQAFSITQTPSTWNIGNVEESGTYPSGITWGNITNTGTETIDITISAGNMTGGGYTWVLSDTAAAGNMTYGLKAGNTTSYTTIVKLNSPYNTLVSDLAGSNSWLWGMKFYAPTVFMDYNEKSGNVTLTATLS